MSEEYQVTPWFDPLVDGNPAINGVYQRQYNDGEVVFSKYTNGEWHCGYDITLKKSFSLAAISSIKGFTKTALWRGIAYV